LVSTRENPGHLIRLQSALEQIVAKKHGTGFVAEWTPATLQGEVEMQMIGGVRTAALEGARAQVKKWLATDKWKLYRVATRGANAPIVGSRVIEVCASAFWHLSDRATLFWQRLILDREEDPSGRWFYALDEADLRSVLGKSVHNRGRPPAPYWAKAEEAAMTWLGDNGYPQSGDGEQAVLERYITELLSRDDVHPGESTVRVHVGSWIANYKQFLSG
jgi:hypothetical protein